MRLVITRSGRAVLSVEGKKVSEIAKGLVVYVGITHTDTKEIAQKVAQKISKMRLFRDDNDKLNLDVKQVGGQILCVSNFTIYGKTDHGNRPDYGQSAKPDIAKPLYDYLCEEIDKYVPVQKGVFGAHMEIDMVADGPVNLVVDY